LDIIQKERYADKTNPIEKYKEIKKKKKKEIIIINK
jgi:hypothetical protein